MPPLASDLRAGLERAVVRAREVSEAGAKAAIAVLGVESSGALAGLNADERRLRLALRARGKALGGGVLTGGIDGLIEEIAYEQWHRMLFARFLAENQLLMHPGGAAVSMAEVSDLAAEEAGQDPWVLAANYGAAMLPGIFRAADPAHRVRFAPEHRGKLEAILGELPAALFMADDSLGWVYQFWQVKRKDDVNKSGRKIGGADIPPVTQLFTEHYMVRFLLENSLGAWWASRHPESPLLRNWEYLRFREDGTPAAGPFEGWPERAAAVTVMDPCCGSGHFLVAAAEMLRAMRIEEEGLSAATAARAVLQDNLFGVELDPRCTQLAAFAVALDAWKAGGHQILPVPNIACSGIAVKGQLSDWQRLAGDDRLMADALKRLYELFQDAPELGSLIDPSAAADEGLFSVEPEAMLAKLDLALSKETDDPAAAVFDQAAEGTAHAARLLAGRYWLVATNPPFLGAGRQSSFLQGWLQRNWPEAKSDLALAMAERCVTFAREAAVVAVVLPQGWLIQSRQLAIRDALLTCCQWWVVARLGGDAFEVPLGTQVVLWIAIADVPGDDHFVTTFDASFAQGPREKSRALRIAPGTRLRQLGLVGSEVRFGEKGSNAPLLARYATALRGLSTGESNRFMRLFWEVSLGDRWVRLQDSARSTSEYAGRSVAILWENEVGSLSRLAASLRHLNHAVQSWRRGKPLWGRAGIAVNRIGALNATLYCGDRFSGDVGVIVPQDADHVLALWAFAKSGELESAVRAEHQKLDVEPRYLGSVPFDLEHWQQAAERQYPNGLPEPHSDDPTQWLFKGVAAGSTAPLHVAVARLLGYRWPDQEVDALDRVADPDGIVALPSVAGEPPAAERLRALLARAYGSDWTPSVGDRLLGDAGSLGATLESWLRDDFFAQHARLFHNRPFIWQVWDGRKDGFSALLNYHRLDRQTLEKLAYTHLNEWVERQRAMSAEPAAEDRLVAALELQRKLALILKGEPPYDIYVRWKSLDSQPIGWEPDLDDGVRLNIRPFVTAGVLRAKFTINWNKDRGANPDGSERLNDLHYTRAQKLVARGQGE